MSLFDRFTKKENKTFAPSSVLPAIIETLNQAGYKAQRDTDVCVAYDDDGLHCYFWYSERDPEFLLAQVCFQRETIPTGSELLLHQVCAKVNASQKAGKAYIDEKGDLMLTVEALIPSGSPIDRLALHMAKTLAETTAFFYLTYCDLTGDKTE